MQSKVIMFFFTMECLNNGHSVFLILKQAGERQRLTVMLLLMCSLDVIRFYILKGLKNFYFFQSFKCPVFWQKENYLIDVRTLRWLPLRWE